MKIRVATDKYEYMGLSKGVEVDAGVDINFQHYYFVLNGKSWILSSGEIEIPKEQEQRQTKFKVGDKVKVVDNLNGHGFKIGDYLSIEEVYETDYSCRKDTTSWFLTENEFELVESKQDQQISQTVEIGKKYRVVKVEKDWKDYDPILEEYLYMEGIVDDIYFEDIVELIFDNGHNWMFKAAWLVPVEEESNQSPQDNVNFPSHYQLINDIEVKDVVKVILSRWQSSGQEMSFNQAGMMKELLQYLLRAPLKNKKEDVLKAQWYLNELVKEWEEE